MEGIAAGNLGHERFRIDDQPGPAALVRFHTATMQHLNSPPCVPLQ